MGSRIRIGSAVVVGIFFLGLAGPLGAQAAPAEGYGKDAWWYKGMGLAEAHKISTGKGVKIAVIDGPIDPKVPELRGQDITAGKNFCGGPGTGTGPNASHATSMVVLIAGNGRGTNPGGLGVAGIAPDAAVLNYAIDNSDEQGAQCAPKSVSAARAEAIDTAVAAGSRLIVIATGTAAPGDDGAAVRRAVAAGVIVVVAAGNGSTDNSVVYPAAFPGVVAVAAVDRNAKPWAGNVKGNREAFVISAPGVEVPTGGFDGNTWRSDAIVTGTSEAAPLVAGGLALVAAKYPKATGSQLIQNLIRNPGGTRTFGRDRDSGFGIISVPKMLASDPAQWPDVNPLFEGVAASEPDPGAVTTTAEPITPGSVPVAAEAAREGGGSSMGLLLGGGLAVVLLVGGLVFALSRRRSAAPSAPTGGWGGGARG